jgi:hypothetical protein
MASQKISSPVSCVKRVHQNALQAARIAELKEQLAVTTKRKTRKRKRIQQDGTMEYGEAAAKVAA